MSIPHVNASDSNPVWVGEEVVFISDRDGQAANLFVFNTTTQALRQLTRETVWDVKSVDAHGDTLVYEVGGRLKTIRLDGSGAADIAVDLSADSPQLRAQWKDASRSIEGASLSPTGKRVVVSARGEVFSVPVKDGSLRNLTETSGVREKDALWSPDGQRIAYLSDAPGRRHQVVIRAQNDAGPPAPAVTHLLPAHDYFTLRAWSPDGQRLVLADQRLQLHALDLKAAKPALQRIAVSPRRQGFGGGFDLSFSPDSRFLATTVREANHLSRIVVFDFQTGQLHPVSDPLVNAENPAFSRKGDLLFFTASTNAGPTRVGLDMSTQERPLRAGVYAAVLAADGASPLLPKAGDEEAPKADAKPDTKTDAKADAKADAKPADKPKAAEPAVKPVRIDFAGLAQRIVPLPIPERDNQGLAVAADGALWLLDRRQPGIVREAAEGGGPAPADLHRFDFEERKAKLVRSGVLDFSLSGDGKKLLLDLGRGRLEVADANDKADGKPLDLSGLKARIDPRAEWQQIFDETWWMQKAFFYDPALHGLDWDAVYQRYLPLLAHVQRREDLNELLVEMIGELQVGHNRLGGGDVHQETPVPVGLLGADFTHEQGAWRIAKIHTGDAFNPFLRSPLAVPGQAAKVGEFVLAVNGQTLSGTRNLYALLENQVGKQVTLTLASSADGAQGRRQIVVQPIASEAALRQWTWVERNREAVDKASGGKVAYVYLPDTGAGGFAYFNRMYFAQADKPALIVDDRRNGGGQAANYITELLARPYLGSWKDRDGLVFDTPGSAIYGPKAMLIDQDAGSGGDFLPYAFKRLGLGPLIGKRTWGGLIGISANPPLIDGGFVTVPFFRFFTPEGEWRIENEGVAPDVDVELDPLAVNAGRDPQLEAAIADVMRRLPKADPNLPRKQAPAPAALGK
jgi:tricorn protease